MDAAASHNARRLACLTACGAGLIIAAAVYMALWTPGPFDLSIAQRTPKPAVVTWVAPNGPAWSAGVVPGDEIIGARPSTATSADLVVRGDGQRIVLGPDATRVVPLDLLVSVVGLCLILFGALILVKGQTHDRRAATAFWRMSMLIGLALGVVPAGFHGALWAIALTFVALTLFGPALLDLTLVFPSTAAPLRRRVLLWLPALLLLLVYLPCWWRPAPLFTLVSTAGDAQLAGYILAACARLAWVRCHPRSRLQLAQLRWVGLGLACGFLPLVALNLVPYVLAGHDLAPPQISILALMLLPLSVGVAIVRTEFLGITSLMRRRTLRLVVSMALLAGVAVVAGLFTEAGPEQWGWSRPVSAAGISVLAALSFIALRATLIRCAERLVLHDVYDTGNTLRRVSIDLTQASPEMMGPLVVTRLSNVLNLTDALLLTPTNQWSYAHPCTTDPVAVHETVIQRALHLFVEPPPREAFVERAADQPILFLPIWSEAGLGAMLCLGPKRSADPYTAQDYALLETLVRCLALVFSNQQLQTQLVEQTVAPARQPLLVEEYAASTAQTFIGPPLTPREMETLRCLAEGLSNKEIAQRMVVVEKTVHKHVSAILDKLDAHNRTEAVIIARRNHLLPPD